MSIQRCTYRVLQFAESEEQADGLAVAVLLRFENLRERFLRLFYLDEWQKMAGKNLEAEISYVEDSLYDFRQYARRSFASSEELMELTANLSVGPLRTGPVGTAELPPLHEVSPALRDDQEIEACSESAFLALLQSISEHTVVDVGRLDDLTIF